ncbi:hypothetical protein LSAT2_016132 [Lamellibrachia satsuma]|nr:hypothetical protein LSAT2_016132 [Lamellibrachia satsuma]
MAGQRKQLECWLLFPVLFIALFFSKSYIGCEAAHPLLVSKANAIMKLRLNRTVTPPIYGRPTYVVRGGGK